MNDKVKNGLNFLMRFGFSGILLWFLSTKIDMEKTAEVLKGADVKYIIFAGLIFMSIHVLLLVRWFLFIRALGLKSKASDVIKFFFIGLFGNLFLPSAIGGDIIKIVGLCKESSQKPRVVASVLLDRLSGFAAIALVASVSFILGYRLIGDPSLILPVVIVSGGLFTLGFVLFNETVYSFFCKIFNFLPKVKSSLMQMHYDISLMKDRKADGFKAIAVSCLCQLLLSIVFYFCAKALGQNISFIAFLIFVPLICVASSFPSIGGLGVREAGAAYLFAKVGVSSGIAVSISLINFLFMIVVGLIGGVVYVITLCSRRVQPCVSDAGDVSSETRGTAKSTCSVD